MTFGDQTMVLRKKPGGEILPRAHAIGRDSRMMNALEPTDLPVPCTILREEDASILGTPVQVVFPLFPFAVIFVGIADRAKAAALGPLARACALPAGQGTAA